MNARQYLANHPTVTYQAQQMRRAGLGDEAIQETVIASLAGYVVNLRDREAIAATVLKLLEREEP